MSADRIKEDLTTFLKPGLFGHTCMCLDDDPRTLKINGNVVKQWSKPPDLAELKETIDKEITRRADLPKEKPTIPYFGYLGLHLGFRPMRLTLGNNHNYVEAEHSWKQFVRRILDEALKFYPMVLVYMDRS